MSLILQEQCGLALAASVREMHRFMVNPRIANIFKRILESWNPAKNAKRFAKSGGRKI